MDLDPDLAWPFWKFGLKKDDLFTKLHDQYNTFPSTIQDPEAFHHDVFECSQEAHTTEDFHRLLTTRREQRLRELNNSLESASLEIIANPSLIGTEQWQYALQLFRTKSLDSLVRYFSSYLPDTHPWQSSRSGTDPLPGYNNDVKSKIHSSTSDEPTFFDGADEKAMLTHEPFSMIGTIRSHLPPSPRSMTMSSDASCDATHHRYTLDTLSPTRTLSFSESESERFTLPSALEDSEHRHDNDSSQPGDPESPISEYSELFFDGASVEELGKGDAAETTNPDGAAATTISQSSVEREAETPTPKPVAHATPFFDTRPSPILRRGCSFSPSRPHPLAQVHSLQSDEHIKSVVSSKLRQRDHSLGRGRRRSPAEQPSRIQKSVPDHVGSRHRGRRRMDEC